MMGQDEVRTELLGPCNRLIRDVEIDQDFGYLRVLIADQEADVVPLFRESGRKFIFKFANNIRELH